MILKNSSVCPYCLYVYTRLRSPEPLFWADPEQYRATLTLSGELDANLTSLGEAYLCQADLNESGAI
jgi:hypothetical protein